MDLNSCCCIYYHRNPTNSHYFNRIPTFLSNPPPTKPLFWRQNHPIRVRALKDDGFVLEVMPLLIDFPPVLPADFCWTGRGSCRTRIIQYTGGLRGARFITRIQVGPT
ncbi:hypothetical protein OIU77_022778 [Salix suchowensis]|uniref:Uncharacterized protein n=1 Tax=Salix suchowensis TaxID=1278906 RepID=A0ABQ9C1E7_9ROSI|nr:hypothetical protein OIU77_022778 [Salix suchowensis]KAJ6393382.1 hypothetical protein OIU77_022778 [Salix suchowensis]